MKHLIYNNLILKNKFIYNFRELSTIYAVSSGTGKCGVAVIRVSGADAGEALRKMTYMKQLPQPRMALLKKIYHPQNKEIIDKGLVIWFPGPKSFTGEDCCEFQVHGGIAVISAVLNALQTIANLEPAKPGEFTRRAFDFGKLNLTEVEGLADLLQAETEMQRKQAFLQTEGALSDLYDKWRTLLIKSVANIEAHIDFEETESLEDDILIRISKDVEILYKDIKIHLENGSKGEILRNGVQTVIIGEPNVGKSSLYNILCQTPAAIVTPIAGTTRDILKTTIDINGYPIILLDTAGLRQTSDLIEQEGVKRASKAAKIADFCILVLDVIKFINWKKAHKDGFFSEYINTYFNNIDMENIFNKTDINNYLIVLNKSDLINENDNKIITEVLQENKNTILMSCINKNGLKTFVTNLTSSLQNLCNMPDKEHPCMNNARHRHLLNMCIFYLEKYFEASKIDEADIVIVAQNLRLALRQLEKLVGHVTTEELLDVIFKDFCIGK